MASVTTRGVVITREGRLGDDVIRYWRAGSAAGLHGCHGDRNILDARVWDQLKDGHVLL